MNKILWLVLPFLLLSTGGAPAYTGPWWVCSMEGLPLREEHDLGTEPFAVIPYGEEVRDLNDNFGTWRKIEWNGSTGWVNGGFLLQAEPEPSSAVAALDIRENRIEGSWFRIDDSGLEDTGEELLFDTDGRYYDYSLGPADTRWFLEDNALKIIGEYYDESPVYISMTWDIRLYRVREDRLVMEVNHWYTDSFGEAQLDAFFLIRTLGEQAEEK